MSKQADEGGGQAPLRPAAPNRYVDFQPIGEGGMGIVYLAHDLEMNRRVAFKVVRPAPQEGESDSATTPMALSPPTEDSPGAQAFEDLTTRFLQEAWITGGMEHPGIAPVYELGRTKGGIPYYTMRYIRGKRTLADAFAECKNLDDRLELLEPFLRVCDTIRYAHSRGVLHRDLKPRNIALGEFGEAIVLDWGLSKVKGQADKTSGIWQSRIQEYRDAADLKTVAGAFGTPGYMAPESLTGAPDATDEQSDVYSLGAILFELLTGKLPFEFQNFMEYVNQALNNEPKPAHERDPAVPEDLSAICARALMLHKEERFKSVDVLAKSVRRWRTEGAKDRAIGELYKKVLAEVEAAEGLQGSALLRHVDRASATCGRLLADRPEHHGGLELHGIIKSLRQRGIHEREEAARRKLLHTIGLLLLITLSVVTVFVAINQKDDVGASGATAEAPVTAGDRAKVEIRRLQTELAESKELESSRRGRLVEAYTSMSKSLLDEGRVGAARVAAAYSLTIGDSIAAWSALAHAERRSAWWTSVVQTGTAVSEFAIAEELDLMYWVTSGDSHVRVLDLRTGKVRTALQGHDAEITCVQIATDGTLYTGSADGMVLAWNTKTGRRIASYKTGHSVRHILPAENGRRLVVGTAPPTVTAFDLTEDGRRRFFEFHEDEAGHSVTALELGSDGETLYVGCESGMLYVCGIGEEDRFDRQKEHDTAVTLLVRSAAGDHIYSGSNDLRLLLWDADEMTYLKVLVDDGGGEATALAASAEADRLLVGLANGTIRDHELGTGEFRQSMKGHGGAVTQLRLGDSGTRIYSTAGGSAGADTSVRTWWPDDRRDVRIPPLARAVELNADGDRLFVARDDRTIEVWDTSGVTSGRAGLRRTLRGHRRPPSALASSPAGTRLFSADVAVRVWDVARGTSTVLGDHPYPVCALAYSEENDRLLAATIDGSLYLWDTNRAWRIARLQGHQVPIGAIAISGKRLVATGDVHGRVFLWDLETREVTQRFDGHSTAVTALAFSPEGRTLVSGDRDGLVLRWSIGKTEATRTQFGAAIEKIAFDDENQRVRLLTGGRLATLDDRQTETPPGDGALLMTAAGRPVRCDWTGAPARWGDTLPWLTRAPILRVIDLENRTGLYLNRFRMRRATPRDLRDVRYAATPRDKPWSD